MLYPFHTTLDGIILYLEELGHGIVWSRPLQAICNNLTGVLNRPPVKLHLNFLTR